MFIIIIIIIRSPVLWTVDLMFYACFLFIFSPTHFFRRLQTDFFEIFPHDVALLEKSAAMPIF